LFNIKDRDTIIIAGIIGFWSFPEIPARRQRINL
jgi:hypothetical protein